MAKVKSELTEPSTFDMTPMIDCVFQLIIFFMLATDMSQKQLEALVAPKAKVAEPINIQDKRLVVNIVHDFKECPDWKIMEKLANEGGLEKVYKNPYRCTKDEHWAVKIRGVTYKDKKRLIQVLKDDADLERETQKLVNVYPSKRVLMIRADFRCPYSRIEFVMQACSDPKVVMYKMEFAAIMPQPDK